MPSAKRKTAAAAVTLIAWLPVQRQARNNFRLGLRRWKLNPVATAADTGFSLVGQAMFWTVGMDFIGVSMKPKWLPGLGHKLTPLVLRRLPMSPTTAWVIKGLEIASDATKIPIEGNMYATLGYVPDGWAYLVTQPLWSWVETVEKLVSAILYPERVNTPEQVANSLTCIYGTWSRNSLALYLLVNGRGKRWRDRLGPPQTLFLPD